MIRNRSLLIIILIFLSVCANAQEKRTYNVAFTPLLLKKIDDQYANLANSIPQLLFNVVENCDIHQYSPEELTFLKERDLEELSKEKTILLSELIKKRDNYLFANDYNNLDAETLDDEIAELKEYLKTMDFSDLPDTETIGVINFIKNDKNTIPISDITKSADLIIKGTLERLDEWIYLEIQTENKITGREKLLYKSVSTPDRVAALIPEIALELTTLLLGRAWASINLILMPEDANVRLLGRPNDKKNIGTGEDDLFRNMYPGLYDLEIVRQGYATQFINVNLSPFEIKTISVDLDKLHDKKISVQSFPGGADLYAGALWIGRTPVIMEYPGAPTLLSCKLEGYNDKKVILTEESSQDIRIFLQSDKVDIEQIIEHKRDMFYRSFGYFLISIPVSLMSYGFSSDYAYAYNGESDKFSEEAERLRLASNLWHNVYKGGIFINVTLFVNAVFDLMDYIKSNEQF